MILNNIHTLQSPFVVSVARNTTASNFWCKLGNVFTNQSPFVLPFDVKLLAISASTTNVETWTAEVYKNADVRAGGTPIITNVVALLTLSVVDAASINLAPINLVANDEIGVFARGSGISKPVVSLFFIRR